MLFNAAIFACMFCYRNSQTIERGDIILVKWNEQAAPNNNLPADTIRTSDMLLGEKADHEFAEELSDGGERDQFIQQQKKKK